VLATRLFWALGFAADRMYPVRVRCTGCPEDPSKSPLIAGKVVEFDPAAIERKLPGRPMETKTDSGWKWSELEDIGAEAPAGARAHRDALKLLAAFVQHTDNKAANQRLLCPEGEESERTGLPPPRPHDQRPRTHFRPGEHHEPEQEQREPRRLEPGAGVEGSRPLRAELTGLVHGQLQQPDDRRGGPGVPGGRCSSQLKRCAAAATSS